MALSFWKSPVNQKCYLKQDIMSLQTLTHFLLHSVWATPPSLPGVLFHHFLFLFQVLRAVACVSLNWACVASRGSQSLSRLLWNCLYPLLCDALCNISLQEGPSFTHFIWLLSLYIVVNLVVFFRKRSFCCFESPDCEWTEPTWKTARWPIISAVTEITVGCRWTSKKEMLIKKKRRLPVNISKNKYRMV